MIWPLLVATAWAQDGASAGIDPYTVGSIVAGVAVALAGGVGGGRWAASRAADPPDVGDLRAAVQREAAARDAALGELRAELRLVRDRLEASAVAVARMEARIDTIASTAAALAERVDRLLAQLAGGSDGRR